MSAPRVLVWFSCGAASAIAAKFALGKYPGRVEVLYCDTLAYEHPDNRRFIADIEAWLGAQVRILRSDAYADIFDVFDRTGLEGLTAEFDMSEQNINTGSPGGAGSQDGLVQRLRRFGFALTVSTGPCKTCHGTGWDGESYTLMCRACGRERQSPDADSAMEGQQ